DGRREDFRRGRGGAVDQHRQGTVPDTARATVTLDLHAALRALDLDHRALVDEQPGELGGFGQRAATVVAQVQHHTVHALGLQFLQQLGHVTGGAAVVGLATTTALEVLVEGWQFNDADATELVALAHLDDALLRRLLFQLHLLAHDGHALRSAVDAGIGRHDVQAHGGILRTADELDGVVDAPADHVHHGTVGTLTHGQDAVADTQARLLGGSAWHDRADDRVFVITLQDGANALQRQTHLDLERIGRTRSQVIGVWLDGHGVGIEERLENVLAVQFLDALLEAHVALVERFGDFLFLLSGQLQAQPVVLHPLAPKLVQLGRVGCPARILAVVVVLLVDGEIE